MAAEERAFHIQSVVADYVKAGKVGDFHKRCLGVAYHQTAAAGLGILLEAHSFVVVDIEGMATNPAGWGMEAVNSCSRNPASEGPEEVVRRHRIVMWHRNRWDHSVGSRTTCMYVFEGLRVSTQKIRSFGSKRYRKGRSAMCV